MNQLDENRQTPLMYAVSSGWSHVVEFLLERGADSSVVDERRTTALMQACSLGLPTIVRQLLNSGASVDDGCTVCISSAMLIGLESIFQRNIDTEGCLMSCLISPKMMPTVDFRNFFVMSTFLQCTDAVTLLVCVEWKHGATLRGFL